MSLDMPNSLQTITLTGVADNGTKRAPRMPRNTATTITIPQFGSVQIVVQNFWNDGVPIPLRDIDPVNYKGIFSVQRTLDPCQVIPEIQKLGTLAPLLGMNALSFTITPKDTRRLPLGRYFFDVWLELNGTRYQVVRVGSLVLLAGLSHDKV